MHTPSAATRGAHEPDETLGETTGLPFVLPFPLTPKDEYIAGLLGSPLHATNANPAACCMEFSFRTVSSQLLVNMMLAYFFLSITNNIL
jgi:hypothetical protein